MTPAMMLASSSSSSCCSAAAGRRAVGGGSVLRPAQRCSSYNSSGSSSSRRLPPAVPARRLQRHAIEEKRDTAGSETTSSPDMLSAEQLQKLAELRRQRGNAPQPSSNIVQGALEEAQLITWPTPGKALLDTVLVLAIVAATGTLLFGLNVVLADASVLWYSH